MGGWGRQDNGGSRRRISKEGKAWGSRSTRMDFLMFLIRFNQQERGFAVPLSVQTGLMRGTQNTEQIKGGGNYLQ